MGRRETGGLLLFFGGEGERTVTKKRYAGCRISFFYFTTNCNDRTVLRKEFVMFF